MVISMSGMRDELGLRMQSCIHSVGEELGDCFLEIQEMDCDGDVLDYSDEAVVVEMGLGLCTKQRR